MNARWLGVTLAGVWRWTWIVLVVASCGRFSFDSLTAGSGATDSGSGGGSDSTVGPNTPNFMFVTSTTVGPGSLGGLTAADAFCQARADAAGLPGTYVAWLSTSTVNARDRLGAARGWVRPDGKPFADTIADIITNRILYPPRIDELGIDHPSGTEYVVTGTSAIGVAQSNTCSDYTTSIGLQVDYGYPYSGATEWTATGSTITCSQPSHLYCFGIDRAVSITPPTSTGRLAFISTNIFVPTGGLSAAHAFCANEASGAGLSGTFLALIAMSASSAKSRFTLGTPWSRVDGVVVTSDLSTLDAPIDLTASGQPLSGMVWTGGSTTATIASTTTTCVDWSSSLNGNVGIYGLSARSSGDFFGVSNLPCSSTMHHLYCLQQ